MWLLNMDENSPSVHCVVQTHHVRKTIRIMTETSSQYHESMNYRCLLAMNIDNQSISRCTRLPEEESDSTSPSLFLDPFIDIVRY